MVRKGPGERSEREFEVFDWTWAVDLSADASRILVCEGDSPGRSGARTYVVPAQGGLPMRLGEGTPLALSPMGTLALVASSGPSPRLLVTPTGPGEPRAIRSDVFEWNEDPLFLDIPWFLDETRVLARYPLGGGEPQPLPAHLPPGAIPVRVSGDGRSAFVGRIGVPSRVDRVELATGRLVPWKARWPEDPTGVSNVLSVVLTADGEGYAYTCGRYFHDLYLVEGLRP